VLGIVLRIGIAFAAGAAVRMLQAFDLMPTLLAMAGLALAGGAMSWRLDVWRVIVVLAVPFGYFVAFVKTMHSAAAVEPASPPSIFLLAIEAARLFLPLAMPAFGSLLALKYEKHLDARKADETELTVESLLEEKIPKAQPELTYDSLDID
jgi:hypothetical protein